MLPRVTNAQFKPVRITVLIGLAAIVACGVAVLYTHRIAHGTTAEERAAYESGEKAGEKAPPGATLPKEAEANIVAQKYFEQEGPTEQLQNPTRAACRLLKRLSEKDTPRGSRKRIGSSEPARASYP